MSLGTLTLNAKAYGANRVDANNVAHWTERSAGVAAGYSPLSLSIVEPRGTKPGRVGFRLEVPVVATSDSTCSCTGTVLRTISFTGYADMAGSSTDAEKTDVLARVIDFMSTTQFTNAFLHYQSADS